MSIEISRNVSEDGFDCSAKIVHSSVWTIHEPNLLKIIAQLYVVERVGMAFLQKQLNLTWGVFSVNISKLEATGLVNKTKEFLNNKPHTTVSLTKFGEEQFEEYRRVMHALINIQKPKKRDVAKDLDRKQI